MIERQELHCHNCDRYVQFNLDMELDGNHVLTCPNCGHEHCRVIENGRITGDRWDQRNGNVYYVSASSTTYSYYSVQDTSTAACSYLVHSWSNGTSYTGG